MSDSERPTFIEKRKQDREEAYEELARRTEFRSAALNALAGAETQGEELASVEAQKAIAYAILELARVTGKSSPKK